MAPDIYQYDDFRAFLKATFDEKVRVEKKYSQRQFAREAGFSNPGYFNDVLKGFKPLSERALEQMARVFGLKPSETEYLKLLTDYGQAKTEDQKRNTYKKMQSRRNRSRFFRLNPAQGRDYQDYRYGLVRGAIEVLDFRGNYEELAEFLQPPIPVVAVKNLIRDLFEWGLVTQDRDGLYRTTGAIVEPAPNMMGLSRTLNATWLQLSAEALHQVPPNKRHVSTLIANISESLHAELLEMIEHFREEVFRKIEKDQGPQRIQQLTLAYVPRSLVREKRKP